ncbi:MAG: hypothetical protein FWG87_02755 [Defluviitaleaceae bacterium]|nr:hypothetical protein [Defluviitaleaceae bacterium]
MSDFMGNVNTIPESKINWATTKREPTAELDKQAFLNLLIHQLRNQDPLNPMDDRDFMAQMAQFSALEQMVNLNTTFERSQAFSMIGKVIDAGFTCPTTGERVDVENALVTAVTRSGSNVYLVVTGENGKPLDVPFDSVTNVSEDFFLSHQLHEIFSQVQGQRATDLIGKNVMGFAVVGDTLEYVEGNVDSIRIEGDIAILFVGNKQLYFPRDVFAVSDNPRLLGNADFTDENDNPLTVDSVEVVGKGNASALYLNFKETNTPARVQVIDHVLNALTYVGTPMSTASIPNGVVDSISLVDGLVYLNVKTERNSPEVPEKIDFLSYIAERTGQEPATSSVFNPPNTDDDKDNDTDDSTDTNDTDTATDTTTDGDGA